MSSNKLFFCLLVAILVAVSSATFAKSGPDTVRVGAYVISVHDIDFHAKEYTIRFWLWFVYDVPKGPSDDPLAFDFPDQIDVPNAKSIDTPEVVRDTIDGKIWIQMKMKCTMKENWKVHDFPFDEQQLKVVVENTIFDETYLIFEADQIDSRFDNVESVDGWTVDNFKVFISNSFYNTGFGDPVLSRRSSTFSTFNLEMDIKRDAGGLFAKIFIGMYIAFLISGLSFLSDPGELEPRFGLPVGGLFAAVGNKYIIDSLLPQSSQFSLVDTLHSLTFFGIFCILMVSAFALKLHNSNKIAESHRVNTIGALVVTSIYILLNLYFIWVA